MNQTLTVYSLIASYAKSVQKWCLENTTINHAIVMLKVWNKNNLCASNSLGYKSLGTKAVEGTNWQTEPLDIPR